MISISLYKATTVLLTLFSLLNSICSHSQISMKDLKLEPNTIYMFCRGTTAKSGLIAEKFNTTDKKITHVGIGYADGNNVKIYNITDIDTSKTALVIDNLESFISSGTYYFSIWKCNNNTIEFCKLKELCSRYSGQKMYFDYSFQLNETDHNLYCSEFCSRILQNIDSKKFDFVPQTMTLDPYYQALLHRKKLIYHPVDFFEHNSHFKKTFEVQFKPKNYEKN